jgi:hypothetical protein
MSSPAEQCAHHLGGVHLVPLARRRWLKLMDTRQDFIARFRLKESLHRHTSRAQRISEREKNRGDS